METATITCPKCGAASMEELPTDACLFFFTCPSCGTRLKPETGDCCVVCTYGDRQCPPRASELAGET